MESRMPKKIKTDDDLKDGLSGLPLFILHTIMSFLPLIDVVRMSILSKQWYNTWRTFPILDFDFNTFRSYLNGFRPNARTIFMRYMESSLQRLPERDLRVQKLRMVIHDLEDVLFVNAFTYAVTRSVRELELFVHSRATWFLHHHSLYSVRSVVVYKLDGLGLNLFDLLQGCPLVQELKLTDCILENDLIVESDKLKILELCYCCGATSYTICARNLESFRYTNYREQIYRVNIIDSIYLKFVSMEYFIITEKWVENLIMSSPWLQYLKLGCFGLKRIVICHNELRTLKLISWMGEGVIINTPKLRYFVYNGIIKPFENLNIIHAASVKATLVLHPLLQPNGRFVEFRKLLLQFSDCKRLKIVCMVSIEDLDFIKKLGAEKVPLLRGIKDLDIILTIYPPIDPEIFVDLIESCIWICPDIERIQLATCYDEVLVKVNFEEMTTCDVRPLSVECWKEDLRKSVVENFVSLVTLFKPHALDT